MSETPTPETPHETAEEPTLSFEAFVTERGLTGDQQARFTRWMGLHAYDLRGAYPLARWEQYYEGALGHIHG